MRKHDLGLAILATIIIVVLISVFNITGSPIKKQQQSRDQQKLNDFSSLSYEVQSYYTNNRQLPTTMESVPTLDLSENVKTSIKNKVYGYQIISPAQYKLCTNFETDTKNIQPSKYDTHTSDYYNYPTTGNLHRQGYDCILYSVTQNSFSTPVPYPSYKPQIMAPAASLISSSNRAQNAGTKTSWVHPTTEKNTTLLVTAAYSAKTNPSAMIKSITYGNSSLTKIRRDHYTDRNSEIWYVTNPTVGTTSTIAVEFTKDPEAQAITAATFRDVDIANPISLNIGDGSNLQNGSLQASNSATLVTKQGDLMVGSIAYYPDGDKNYLNSQSQSTNYLGAQSADLTIGNSLFYKSATSQSTSLAWKSNQDYSWAGSFIVLKYKNNNPNVVY